MNQKDPRTTGNVDGSVDLERRKTLKRIALGTAGVSMIPLLEACSREEGLLGVSPDTGDPAGEVFAHHVRDLGKMGEGEICPPCCPRCRELYWDKYTNMKIYTGEISVGNKYARDS